MREIRLYDSLSGELVAVSPGDAIRVEVRTSPVAAPAGMVDVGSTRPFVLFSFLERYLQREGFGNKFLFNSPGAGDSFFELPDDVRGGAGGQDGGGEGEELALLPVSRSDIERWVNVCFGADRNGREWPPAAPDARVPLNVAMKGFGQPAVALYLLGTHYSQPLGDASTALATGSRHARRLREIVATLEPDAPSPADMRGHVQEFQEALADDLDTPSALVSMFEWVLEAERRGSGVGDRDLRRMFEPFELEDLLERF